MNTMKKIQADKNGCKYILFRIDIYFSECSLAVEIDEKGHTDRHLIFEEKRHQKKILVVNLLELIQVMQKMVMIQIMRLVMQQAFIDEFKHKKIKKLEKQLIKDKEMREKLEKEMREMREMRNEK